MITKSKTRRKLLIMLLISVMTLTVSSISAAVYSKKQYFSKSYSDSVSSLSFNGYVHYGIITEPGSPNKYVIVSVVYENIVGSRLGAKLIYANIYTDVYIDDHAVWLGTDQYSAYCLLPGDKLVVKDHVVSLGQVSGFKLKVIYLKLFFLFISVLGYSFIRFFSCGILFVFS